jgi:hypothetical protein
MTEGARVPPRFVPVLTEIVDPALTRPSSPAAAQTPVPRLSTLGLLPQAEPVLAPPSPQPPAAPPLDLRALEDQLMHRLMQRVDVSLERYLHDAVASMVLQHTHALVPRLREEVEFVVRQAVSEAVAAEFPQRPTR